VYQTPVLIDTFSPADLAGVDLPVSGSVLYPYGLAMKKDGTLIVACGSVVLAMDQRWQVSGLPAKKLSGEGIYNFAYMVFLTKAETMYLRSTDGSGLWAFPDGQSDYRRMRSEGQPGTAFGVMDDGSTFVVETDTVRVSRGGIESRFKLPQGVSTMAAGAGPDDTIWLHDMMSSSMIVLSTAGMELRRFKTDLPLGTILMKLRVQADGGFLGVTNYGIRRFDSSGNTVWSWDGKDEGLSVMFSTYTDMAVADDGILYVNDFMGRRILRLSERPAFFPANLVAVAKAAKAARQAGDKPELALALADAYEAMGATEAARVALSRYLDERPADARAQDRKLKLEAALLKAKAASAASDVMDLLDRYGAETARDSYSRAMRTWESLLASVGDDDDIRAAMATLRTAFQSAERGTVSAGPAPKIVSTEIAALFPALLQLYRTKPAGKVVVRNTLTAPIRNVRVDLFIKKYMDFPSEGTTIARIDAGKEASLDIFALLNEATLEVQEDLPVQAQLTVHFSDAGGERTVELSRSLILYRRTAISWDDTGKLAAFITPNEDTVARMAFNLLGSDAPEVPVSRTFASAARICDSLGALPLSYVKDPQSPIDTVLSATGSVDTVRFPRTTLTYRAGDCDDTTALLASLLEAVGIPTAIMTSPGHVFLAFDTGEPVGNAWLFTAPGFRTMQHGGTLWIPVESTILSDGFTASWKAASSLVEKYSAGGELGFLPVAAVRASYPALPLSPSTLPTPVPDSKRLASLGQKIVATLGSDLYKNVVKTIETERKSQTGAVWNRSGNRLAQLHSRFGYDAEAVAVLSAIATKDPAYVPALLNLAGLAQKSGKADESLAWLRRAAAMSPGSTVVANYAKAMGLGEAMGFGAAIVGTPTTGSAPLAGASSDRASAPGSVGWAGD
jgi:tetratricopeptide (TPR) repeat protein